VDEPVLFTHLYAMVLRLHELAPRLPKVHRPTLVRRLLDSALDLLGAVTDLRYTRQRTALFLDADRHLDRLRVLSRLAVDLRIISVRQYEQLAADLGEAGRMLGGWKKTG
jgi:hypothetical protein